jgi:hypothetical protein
MEDEMSAKTKSALTESALRARAKRNGYRLCKSRRNIDLDNFGGYTLLDASQNFVVRGSRFDATLEDIADFLGSK